MRKLIILILTLALVLGFALTANAKKIKIWVQQDKYTPNMDTSLEAYKKVKIFLANFENKAENTTIWYYYGKDSKGKKVTYEGAPSLQSYLWYCFEKAMLGAGMSVYRDTAPNLSTPELQLTFSSWTDLAFDCEVSLLANRQQLFRKTFNITFEPATSDDPAQLEQRAYKQMDKIISTIMSEEKLKGTILK